MVTECFVEGQLLDLTNDVGDMLLTFALDDVKDFSKRQTTFSKTIVLPGTANNNKVLGNIFVMGRSSNYDETKPNVGANFNLSKSAACIIFQDNIQTFKGVLRVLSVKTVKGTTSYEVAVFGDLLALNSALTAKLEELDFSAYDHVYDETAVINSWDNTPGSGYYYPLIDHGGYSVNKHDWDIKTFRPALYVKEYIDKMFKAAGFRYTCTLFNTDRFKRLVIPFNQKKLTTVVGTLLDIKNTPYIVTDASESAVNIEWDSVTLSSTFVTGDNVFFTYENTETLTLKLTYKAKVISATVPTDNLYLAIFQNNTEVFNQVLSTGGEEFSFDINLVLNNGDYINFTARTVESNLVTVDLSAVIGSSPPVTVDLNIGNTVSVNSVIPKNIRQVDFLLSIVKLFNLYIYEDKFDERLMHIAPYIDFYSGDAGDAVDWTYKLDRNADMEIKPMSELNSKVYQFNYKTDSDYFNDLYNKRYSQVYGSLSYDSEYEFADQTNKFELIFSPTPLVGYIDEDKIYPTIFKRTGKDDAPVEEQVDSNIRIMQTKKVTGVTSWTIKNGSSVLATTTDYGYAGHFNDPDAPTNDLNFGALQELFFVLSAGDLSNTQFNLYWSAYMAEVVNPDALLFTGSFYLKPMDIYNLDFSKYITVDGVLFRLNKITDYSTTTPQTSKVELLKVNYTRY